MTDLELKAVKQAKKELDGMSVYRIPYDLYDYLKKLDIEENICLRVRFFIETAAEAETSKIHRAESWLRTLIDQKK